MAVTDPSKLTVVALRALAKSNGLSGYSRLNKSDLIALLSKEKVSSPKRVSIPKKSPTKTSKKVPVKKVPTRSSPRRNYANFEHQNVLIALYKTKMYAALTATEAQDQYVLDRIMGAHYSVEFKPLEDLREKICNLDKTYAKAKAVPLAYFVKKEKEAIDALDRMNGDELLTVWKRMIGQRAQSRYSEPPKKLEDVRVAIRNMQGHTGFYPWQDVKIPAKYIPKPVKTKTPKRKVIKGASSTQEQQLAATNLWRAQNGKPPLKSLNPFTQ